MTPLLVLPRVGERSTAWRAALGRWDGESYAPELPDTDYFDPADLVMAALRALRERAWSQPPVVVAIGSQFVAAHVLALAGRAAGIAVVDFPPLLAVDPDEGERLQYEWLRRVADDPGAHNGLPPFTDALFWEAQRASITVPALELRDDDPAAVLTAVAAWWGDVVAAQR